MADLGNNPPDQAEGDATSGLYFCHQCKTRVGRTEEYSCAACGSGFIEEINPEEEETSDTEPNERMIVQIMEVLREGLLRGPQGGGNEGDAANGAAGGASRRGLSGVEIFNSILGPNRARGNAANQYFELNEPFLEVLYGNMNDYAWGPEGLDTVVTQLLNQFETSGPPPLNKEEITSLPQVDITQTQVDSALQCTVCMEDFALNERVRQLNCLHLFHNDCIVPWLETHATCPICRKVLKEPPPERASEGDEDGNASQSGSNNRAGHDHDYYTFG